VASGVSVPQLTFGIFGVDLSTTRLLRDGVEVELRPQAVAVLRVLVQNCGRPVDYDQMIREAWDGFQVSRHTVAVTVGEAKRALREFGSWISCRPGLGYCLEIPQSDALIRKGWHFLSHRTREGLEHAVECFRDAARTDSADFRAFEGLSRAYLTLGTSGMRPPREVFPAFLEAHRQAVALTGLTPELRSDRAYAMHMFERRLEEAESELLQACREQPTLACIYVRLTMLYAALGQMDDAVGALEAAYAADPLMPVLPATEVAVRFCRREFDRATECGKKAVELHPYVQFSRVFYAQALEYVGRTEEALAQYRSACAICPDVPWLRALEGACLARCGQRREAAGILSELERIRATEYVDAYYMVVLREALGQRDEAFLELERAYDENSAALSILRVDPKMDPLRGDGRFARWQQLAATCCGSA
jgi:DNA-binding winged helix-turn-helix (wHTH) protein